MTKDIFTGREHAQATTGRVEAGDSCGTGVVVPVDLKSAEPVSLWGRRGTKILGFSPDSECRKGSWHIREFFQSLFGKQPAILLGLPPRGLLR